MKVTFGNRFTYLRHFFLGEKSQSDSAPEAFLPSLSQISCSSMLFMFTKAVSDSLSPNLFIKRTRRSVARGQKQKTKPRTTRGL